MSLQLELANTYFLKPLNSTDEDYNPLDDYTQEELDTYPDLVEDNALVVGSRYVMNEVAVHMTDDDVIVTTGVAPERCVIITTLSRERCKEIIQKGKDAFDAKTKRILDAEA